VYDTGEIDPDKLATGDPLLRLLALGPQYRKPTAASECTAILREAAARGRSDRSFCPIARMDGKLIVFRMDPLVPTLRQMFDRFGFPRLRQFGPARRQIPARSRSRHPGHPVARHHREGTLPTMPPGMGFRSVSRSRRA